MTTISASIDYCETFRLSDDCIGVIWHENDGWHGNLHWNIEGDTDFCGPFLSVSMARRPSGMSFHCGPNQEHLNNPEDEMDYNAFAKSLIAAALEAKLITRTNFNYARRCGAMMGESTESAWNTLNGEIWDNRCQIVEDGDIVFEVALSFDDTGRVNRVMSL